MKKIIEVTGYKTNRTFDEREFPDDVTDTDEGNKNACDIMFYVDELLRNGMITIRIERWIKTELKESPLVFLEREDLVIEK